MSHQPPPFGPPSAPPPSQGAAWPTMPSAAHPALPEQPLQPQQQQAYPAYPSPSYVPPPHFGYQQPPATFGYAAPAASGFRSAPAGTGAPALRWVVLGSYVSAIALCATGLAINEAANHRGTGADIGIGLAGFSMLLIVVYFVSGLVWLYKSWAMLPPEHRVTGNGTMVSPAGAVGFLFVPFYNLYWVFVCSAGLTTAYNCVLESYGSPKRASRGLAITAAVLQVIPYANYVLGPFFWLAFMLSVEGAKREYARLASAPPPMV